MTSLVAVKNTPCRRRKIYQPPYYQRDVKEDLRRISPKESEESTAMRTCKAALPILCLYKPLKLVIATSLGSVRLVSHIDAVRAGKNTGKSVLGLVLAICSLTTLFFHFQLASYFTTLSDLSNNLWRCTGAFLQGKQSLALSHLLKGAHNVCYLSIMHTGGLQIIFASMLLSSLSSFYEGCLEGSKGRCIETGSRLFIAGFRLHESFGQYHKIQDKKALEKITKLVKMFGSASKEKVDSHFSRHYPQDIQRKLRGSSGSKVRFFPRH